MKTPDTNSALPPDTQAPPPPNTNEAPPEKLASDAPVAKDGTEEGALTEDEALARISASTAYHVPLMKDAEGKVFVMRPWPLRTTVQLAHIDGGTINRTGSVITFHVDNGIAAYAITSDEGDPLALELQPGSIYDEKAPDQGPIPADDVLMAATGHGLVMLMVAHNVGPATSRENAVALLQAKRDGKAVTEPVTEAVTAPVTALDDAAPPPIPADLHLEELSNRALSDLMDDHGIDGGTIENRAHAILVLGEKRDSILPVGPVEVLIEGEPEIVAQDGTTPGSVWNVTHQLWAMPTAA